MWYLQHFDKASGFKLFNSRGPGPPQTPSPGFKLFKLFNSRPELNNLNMGEASGFKLFKLFNSRPQLSNLNNLNNLTNLNNLHPGGGPRGGVRDPPRELNNLNPGGSPVFILFKLFNSRPRASPPDPLPQDLNYVNYLNYLIPGPN